MSLNGENKIEKFVQSATRGPKRGISEQLMCLKLVTANRTDQLQRIALICEAVWAVDPEKIQEQKINLETVEMLHTVATALSGARRIIHFYNGANYPIFPVMWGFEPSEANYNKYIKPWRDGNFAYYSDLIRHCLKRVNLVMHSATYTRGESCALFCVAENVKENNELLAEFKKRYPGGRCPQCGGMITGMYNKLDYEEKILIDYSDAIALYFEGTQYPSEEGYLSLRNQFIKWAQPIATRIEAQIAKLINPDIYRDFFRDQVGQKEGDQDGAALDKGI